MLDNSAVFEDMALEMQPQAKRAGVCVRRSESSGKFRTREIGKVPESDAGLQKEHGHAFLRLICTLANTSSLPGQGVAALERSQALEWQS
jgi:hypothetical protein